MVGLVKLLFPYAQLGFIGWVVWTADAPQWQTVGSVLLLAWIALGITALRIASLMMARAITKGAAGQLADLMSSSDFDRITKPRIRR